MYRIILGLAICFFFFILWIIYLANTGGSSVFFEFVAPFPYGDKVGHAGLFGCLTLFAIIGLKFSRVTLGKLPIYYGGILVSLFVIGEELSQAFIPSRTFDFVDLAADFVGIVVAIGVAHFMSKHLVKNEKICSTK